jgi:hypothetical protein
MPERVRGAGGIAGPRAFAAHVTSGLTRAITSALRAVAAIDLSKRAVHRKLGVGTRLAAAARAAEAMRAASLDED